MPSYLFLEEKIIQGCIIIYVQQSMQTFEYFFVVFGFTVKSPNCLI